MGLSLPLVRIVLLFCSLSIAKSREMSFYPALKMKCGGLTMRMCHKCNSNSTHCIELEQKISEADVWKPVHIKPELSAWLDNTKGKWENGFSLLFGSAGCLIRGQRVQAGSPSMTLNVGLFFSLQPMKPHYMHHSNTAIIIMPFKSSTNAHQRLH